MRVKDLRKALEGVDGELEIVVRAFNDDGDVCVGLDGAEVQFAHDGDDTPFFVLDGFEGDNPFDGIEDAADRQEAPEVGE